MFYKSLPLASVQTMYTTNKPLHVLYTLYDLTKEGRHNISNSDITKSTDIQGKDLYDALKILLEQDLIREVFSINGILEKSGYTAVSITDKGLLNVEDEIKLSEELSLL
ncbi:hypothetical protein QT995_17210 [Microcoleus sp. S36b_A3]|uniref:hypothetical protein n=1 Tax=unclassified Microcoleus TaxID=2642155 RepID=UPI002FCE7341